MNDKQRSCSLWLRIVQDGKTTWYRVKTKYRGGGERVQRILVKMDASMKHPVKEYTVTEPLKGRCSCTCPDWSRTQLDCKHILALRANDYIGGFTTVNL